MPTTPALKLPYPAPTATPDVPYDMQQLAEKIEAKVPGASTGKAGKRMHWQTFSSASTDSAGIVTYNHSAGFTPTTAVAVSGAPGTNFCQVWGVYALTSTQVSVRFCLATTNGVAASQSSPILHVFFGE